MTEQCAKGPNHSWTIRGWRFSRYDYGTRPWECVSPGGYGCAARTPVGAFLRARRFQREVDRRRDAWHARQP